MVITCTKENLLRGLLFAERATVRHPSLPILSHVLLRPATGKLVLEATDLDIAICARIPAKIDAEETFTLPLRAFLGFVQTLPEETVTLQKKGKAIHIQAGSYHGTLQYGSSDDFPIIPEVPAANTITLTSARFAEALQQTMIASAVTNSRPELTGVFVHFDGERITLAATDTFRLAFRVLETPEPAQFSLILPHRTVREAIRLFGEEPVTFSYTENQCAFSTPETTLVSRLIHGTFPDFRAILPQAAAATFTLQKQELLQKLEGAAFFTSRLNDIRFTFHGASGTVSMRTENSDIGSFEATLQPHTHAGEDQDVSVNLRYFLEGVRGLGDETIVMELNGETKPLVVKTATTPFEDHYLIMPIRKQ